VHTGHFIAASITKAAPYERQRLRKRDLLARELTEPAAYTAAPVLADRFALEAAASLPGLERSAASLGDIFSAVTFQQMRLRHDQQVPEWSGPHR
jgi:hypothetical protein